MLIFNCTKAAADFFTTTRKGNKISPMSPSPKTSLAEETILHDHKRWHWMMHVSKINRRNVLLAMDSDSRFCMAFWGLRKGNIQNFLELFHHRLALHIISFINMSGQDEAIFEKCMTFFLENHNEYAFVQRGDRSVQAHINDAFMSLQYEPYQWEDDIPTEDELFISDLKRNDTPRKRKQDKDYLFSNELFFQTWLFNYASLSKQDIKRAIYQYQQQIKELWGFPFDMDVDALNFNEFFGEDEPLTAEAPSNKNNVLPFKPR
jgi:hypothetical protein